MRDVETDQDVEVPESPRRPARLAPFRALRLTPSRIADPAALRPLGKPYRDAARRLAAWESAGSLTRDADPALYLHEYSSQGMTVRGVVGALDVSTRAASLAERAVLPHEAIHPEQADDLARRMGDIGLDPAPILLVHRGTPQGRAALDAIASAPPTHSFTDKSGQRHRQWRIQDPEQVALLGESSLDQVLLADGHHRFAAYLRLQARAHGRGWDCGLAMLVDQQDTPLFLGAIHRTLTGRSLTDIGEAAREAGDTVSRTSRDQAVAALRAGTWAMTDGSEWMTVVRRGAQTPDVVHLHAEILPRLDPTPVATYRHTVEEALTDTQGPSGAVAVILPAPTFEQLEASSQRGELLPEKATSFQPKPGVGAFMRAVRD